MSILYAEMMRTFNAGDSETGLILILMSMSSKSHSPSLNTLSH